MSREVRRVPLDFDWPVNQPWQGFLLPESLLEENCETCDRRGTTAARQWVEQITALFLLLDGDLHQQRLGRPMHPYLNDTGSRAWGVRPSADIAEFGTGLAGRAGHGPFGHDGLDQWAAQKKIIAAAGLDPDTWGLCPDCAGHGCIEKYDGQRAAADAWESTEPPTGDGWQVWETVSEGSPISPVLPTRAALVEWLQSPAYQWGTSRPLTAEQAENFVSNAWAPTMVFSPGTGLVSGDQFIFGGER